jgi:hypothetical protein
MSEPVDLYPSVGIVETLDVIRELADERGLRFYGWDFRPRKARRHKANYVELALALADGCMEFGELRVAPDGLEATAPDEWGDLPEHVRRFVAAATADRLTHGV